MIDRATTILAARVPNDVAAAFEQMAVSEDRTVSQELRRAIRAHVAQNENGRPQKPTALQTRAEMEPAHAA